MTGVQTCALPIFSKNKGLVIGKNGMPQIEALWFSGPLSQRNRSSRRMALNIRMKQFSENSHPQDPSKALPDRPRPPRGAATLPAQGPLLPSAHGKPGGGSTLPRRASTPLRPVCYPAFQTSGPSFIPIKKIGRASCRERVSSPV